MSYRIGHSPHVSCRAVVLNVGLDQPHQLGLVKNADSQASPQTYWIKSLGLRPWNGLRSLPGDCGALKFGNHFSGETNKNWHLLCYLGSAHQAPHSYTSPSLLSHAAHIYRVSKTLPNLLLEPSGTNPSPPGTLMVHGAHGSCGQRGSTLAPLLLWNQGSCSAEPQLPHRENVDVTSFHAAFIKLTESIRWNADTC